MQPKILGLISINIPSIRWVPDDIDTLSSQSSKGLSQKSKTASPSFLHLPKVLSKLSTADSSTSATKSGSSSHHSTTFRYNRHHKRSALELSEDDLVSRVHPQNQSSFFDKLPPEVRNLVYGYVMGEETVHLTMGAKKRFAHFVCQDECTSDYISSRDEGRDDRVDQGWCRCKVLVGGKAHSARYLEGLPHLYNNHTFSLLHITHLLYLPKRTPLCTLTHIRSLCLRWSIRALPYYYRAMSHKPTLAYPEDTENWERAWDILGNMDGLRDLRVVILSREGIWEAAWLSLEEKLVESIKKVARVKRVEVVLPYQSCRVDWDVGNVVFSRPGNGRSIDEV
ncbi:hypothetical protein DM02DRAFT_592037 [Periconia macrospinosa]|uniref:DUF7730 domain-containing protein n=1 Tax=Periconia macrospinosa TaxID=97972 RepID=A0A2V1DSB5_9PLEO|nr:hypothetical protein DM02DRAFT_592037 [Periconia macrospinosa]